MDGVWQVLKLRANILETFKVVYHCYILIRFHCISQKSIGLQEVGNKNPVTIYSLRNTALG